MLLEDGTCELPAALKSCDWVSLADAEKRTEILFPAALQAGFESIMKPYVPFLSVQAPLCSGGAP